MKVKHCFFFILLVLASGTLFLALSATPIFKSSLKSYGKDAAVSSPKSGRSNERASNGIGIKQPADAASSDGSTSTRSPGGAPSPQPPPPVPSPQLPPPVPSPLSPPPVDEPSVNSDAHSQDDLRARLQEMQLKLKAAEEEIQALQAQKPPTVEADSGNKPSTEEADSGNRCRIFQRESMLCKAELRSTHAKVFRSSLALTR